jgi:sugar phosphate isomerase/epimerase
MKPSIWTTMLYPSTPAQALEVLASHGWQAFELSCEHIGALQQMGPAALREWAATRDRLGVEVPQCHATILADVASADPARRQADLAAIHRDIDTCSELGISNIVIHPGGGLSPDRATLELVTKLRLEAFAELAAHCERAGTRLAIENMADGGSGVWGSRQFGGIVEEILGLIDQIGSPVLGVCLDTSHANIMRLNQPEAIRTCGEKLIALHISDNDTSGDQHKAPLYGSVDMPGVVAALKEVGFKFNFNLEIPGENDRGHARPEIIELRSRYALGVCEYLLR